MTLKVLMVLVTAAAFSACGQPGCTGVCAQVRPMPSVYIPTRPDPGFDVLITERDRDVAVNLGQRLEVYLVERDGMTTWSSTVSDDLTVLRPIDAGIVAQRNITVTGFFAAGAGTANLTSYASPKCSPGQACPAYAMLFEVRVTVS